MRYSKYCNTHYKFREKPKGGISKWFTNIKDKYWDKRVEHDKEGKIKDVNKKGFRDSWFYR
jgi:hypothetical protein